jgi:hypothetical protein
MDTARCVVYSMMRVRALSVLLLTVAIAWTMPLIGLAMAGEDITPFLHFPPRTEFVRHAPFAWSVFIALLLTLSAMIGLSIAATARANGRAASAARRFPTWGWLGLALLAAGWALAWTDDWVPVEWRRHTFTPLWLGYVVVMNALAWRRSGHSPLTHRTHSFIALFPVSALFWWLFEHLNQFVDNWYYTGVYARSDAEYFLQATLPFSTVLPAVASTIAWLRTFPRLEHSTLPAIHGHRTIAWVALLAGVLALAAIGTRPEILYAMLWIGPLLILASLQQLLLASTLLSPLAHGDWRPLLQPALAGLICGFFWELWNSGSLAQWHYSVPYVQRFHLFEMPLLGYAGYLPFGVECALVMDLIMRIVERRGLYEAKARGTATIQPAAP